MNCKTHFFNILNSFFKNKGYIFYDGPAPKFLLDTKDYVVQNGFNYMNITKSIYGGKLNLSIKVIEDIILEIQYPNKEFEYYLERKEDFLPTIGDLYGKLQIEHHGEIDTEEKILKYTDSIKSYIDSDGQIFIHKYTYLPNILEEMDTLENEGKNWLQILAGSLDGLFRGLIVSKLCGDKNFHKKEQKMDEIFNRPAYENWLPYYQKLKERLTHIAVNQKITLV